MIMDNWMSGFVVRREWGGIRRRLVTIESQRRYGARASSNALSSKLLQDVYKRDLTNSSWHMATSARDFASDISHYLAIYFSKQYGDVAVC